MKCASCGLPFSDPVHNRKYTDTGEDTHFFVGWTR